MKAVLQLFWQICRLKQSPEFVPTQGWFVALVVLANLLCSVLVSATADTESSLLSTTTRIVVNQATTAALTWLLLNIRGLTDRFITTITALFGCDLIITALFAVMLPLEAILPAISRLLILLFLVWSVTVAGFILHRAMDLHIGVGIVVALGMSVVSVALGQMALGIQ